MRVGAEVASKLVRREDENRNLEIRDAVSIMRGLGGTEQIA